MNTGVRYIHVAFKLSMFDLCINNFQTFFVRFSICFTLDGLVLFSLSFVGKANMVGTDDGF